MPYILSCCSAADLDQDYLDSRNINCIFFNYSIDGKHYKDDIGKTISCKEFYDLMRNGADTKTSQINPDEFINYFSSFLEAGHDVLHVCLSSGISGVYNSACIARDKLKLLYPNRKIYIVDSLCASSGYGLLVDKLADLRDNQKNINEVYNWAELNKLSLNTWFFTSDLSFFIKGGRISKISGWVGTVLNICPLLSINNEGKLVPRFKTRGKKKAMELTINQMELNAENNLDYAQKCFVSHSDCYDDAKTLAALIHNKFLNLNGQIKIFNIGTTIGSHTGPGTVALFFWGSHGSRNM